MSGYVIEFQNVNMVFGKKAILKDVSFTVSKGETLAVIGPSGSGKSTILRLLIGLLEPTEGKILINGQDVSQFDEDHWNVLRQKMGMVFQYSALFDFLTVGENVAFGLRQHTELSEAEIQKIVAERLEQVGLPGTQAAYPAELSGGMKKRVSLARATALQPGIVLYDEPTAGLDPMICILFLKLPIELLFYMIRGLMPWVQLKKLEIIRIQFYNNLLMDRIYRIREKGGRPKNERNQ